MQTRENTSAEKFTGAEGRALHELDFVRQKTNNKKHYWVAQTANKKCKPQGTWGNSTAHTRSSWGKARKTKRCLIVQNPEQTKSCEAKNASVHSMLKIKAYKPNGSEGKSTTQTRGFWGEVSIARSKTKAYKTNGTRGNSTAQTQSSSGKARKTKRYLILQIKNKPEVLRRRTHQYTA